MSKMNADRKFSMENLSQELRNVLEMRSGDPNGPTYQSLRKMNAKYLLKKSKYAEVAYNFVESLAPSVRTMATYRYEKYISDIDKKKKIELCSVKLDKLTKQNNLDIESDELLSYINKCNISQKSCYGTSLPIFQNNIENVHLNKSYIKHVNDDAAQIHEMKQKLEELPSEWTVLQITAGYDPCEQWQTQQIIKSSVKEFYITALKSPFLTLNENDPFTIKIAPEKLIPGEKELFDELHSTIKQNLISIDPKTYTDYVPKYWLDRSDCDSRMKSVISAMDNKWLRGWRCLLNGKIVSKSLQDSICKYIDDIISENRISLCSLQKKLLYVLYSSSQFLVPEEVSLLLHKIYTDYSDINVGKNFTSNDEYKAYKKIFMGMFNTIKYTDKFCKLKDCERGPIILLIDEKLDSFPWEILPILFHNSVTRMECLNTAYALFKKHKDNISNGYFQLKPDIGRFIINPGGDLKRMEKRMSSFVNYWCPNWKGEKNNLAPSDTYDKFLRDSNIFLYCGHGDGSRYINGGVDRLSGVNAVTVLSGCGSVGLFNPGTRFLSIPTHSFFHIATCPCVIGMLWAVTDLEIDKVTSMLLGLFLPSKAPKHWGNIVTSQWTQGSFDIANISNSIFDWQPNLLKALSESRKSTNHIMISASIVARGLPVKIHSDYKLI